MSRSPTPFEERVYRVVRRIPAGSTRTYRWVAEQLGDPSLARAVGNALNRNPCLRRDVRRRGRQAYATEAGTAAEGRGRRRQCRSARADRPPQVPCHRVIKSDGTLGGFAWGPKKKRRMLQDEGVRLPHNFA